MTRQINTLDTASKPIKKESKQSNRHHQARTFRHNSSQKKIKRTQAVVWCLKVYICVHECCDKS